MNELLKLGFTEKEIDNLIKDYDENRVYSLILNFENTKKIFNTLKSMHVSDVKNLVFCRIDLFTMNYDEFVLKLKNSNITNIGERINDDVDVIEDIFFN